MNTDLDLPALISRSDHVNVLRHIRVFELREPALVLKHGRAWLGPNLQKSGGVSPLVRLAALEQICLAALDLKETELSEICLDRLRESGVAKDSTRFRRLLARCLEAAGDEQGAVVVYKDLMTENATNTLVFKRMYALQKAKVDNTVETVTTLHHYLEQKSDDAAAWYEMAELRRSMGDYKTASFCLEEVLWENAADSGIHCELAECYATIAAAGKSTTSKNSGARSYLDYALLARMHMAQSLELDPENIRAVWGLLQTANLYLLLLEQEGSLSDEKEHQKQVAQALIEYATKELCKRYKGTAMEAAVKQLTQEFL